MPMHILQVLPARQASYAEEREISHLLAFERMTQSAHLFGPLSTSLEAVEDEGEYNARRNVRYWSLLRMTPKYNLKVSRFG